MTRRTVRTSQAFFDQLDEQLGTSRGPNGEPSATDFLVVELPAIVEAFATRFDEPPVSTSCPKPSRACRTPGWRSALVRAFAVYGLSMADDSVELIGVEIDLAS